MEEVQIKLWLSQFAFYLVGQLMGDNRSNPLLGGGVRDAWLVQQGCLLVGDQAPVLHRPQTKVRDGNHVQLGQGEGHLEEVLKEIEDLGSNVPSILRLVKRRGLRPNAEPHLTKGIFAKGRENDN